MQKEKERCKRNKMHEDNNKPKWNAKENKIKKCMRNKMCEDDNKCKVTEM